MLKLTALLAYASLIIFLLTACNPAIQPKEEVEQLSRDVKPSLTTYTDTLTKLDKRAPGTIDHAVRLYGVLVPHDSTSADSAASALMHFIKNVVTIENDSMFKDTNNYSILIDPTNQSLTQKQQSLLSKLHENKLKLVSDGEGGAYLVPSYETILSSMQARTSEPVDNYLSLVAKEDTTPVFMDAGIVVEMPELVDRLITTEQLMTQKLPEQFKAEAARLNHFYTTALLMGSDNSPLFELDSITLNESFKKGYDYLLAKYPSSKAAAKINVWLAVLASGDKTKIEAYRRTIQ